jgi:hypothetical protein
MRALVCLSAIVPSGVLMGFGFPTGMSIVNGIDPRPTPWFWAVNGAAGVRARRHDQHRILDQRDAMLRRGLISAPWTGRGLALGHGVTRQRAARLA